MKSKWVGCWLGLVGVGLAGCPQSQSCPANQRWVASLGVCLPECVPGNAGIPCFDSGMHTGTDAGDGAAEAGDGAVDGGVDAGDGAVSACPAGYERVEMRCEVRVPRAIAPMSTAGVTTHSPTLRWALPEGVDSASVELCRDRAIATSCRPAATVTGSSFRPGTALDPGVWFWRVTGRVGATMGQRASAVWWFRVPPRDTMVDGVARATLDLNGDGFTDVAIGAPGVVLAGRITASGTVSVYLGSRDGLPPVPTAVLEPSIEVRGFGRLVSSAGDVNGDGIGDLLVGAEEKVMLYLGRAGSAVPRTHDQLFERGAIGPSFGRAIAGGGDCDRDGYGDIVLAAPDETVGGRTTVGRVLVYRGGPMGVVMTPAFTLDGIAMQDAFGLEVRFGSDFNGDGFADLAVAAPYASFGAESVGNTSVFLGGEGGFAGALRHRTLRGGRTLAVGDFSGDGRADVAVMSDALTYYVSNRDGLPTMPTGAWTVPTSEEFPQASALVDLNGDGRDELVLGRPVDDMLRGSVSVHQSSGSGPAQVAVLSVRVGGSAQSFGNVMGLGAWLDADEYPDLLLALPADERGIRTGHVRIMRGASPLRVTVDPFGAGSAEADQFGAAIAP